MFIHKIAMTCINISDKIRKLIDKIKSDKLNIRFLNC